MPERSWFPPREALQKGLEPGLVEADPQRVSRAWARGGAGLLLRRLQADLLAIAAVVRLLPLLLRYPPLGRLAWELLQLYPPGLAQRVARFHGEMFFGETPLATAVQLLRAAGVGAGENLVELGAGAARVSFVAAALFGARVTAVEKIPEFVRRGQRLAARLELPVKLEIGDLEQWSPRGERWAYLTPLGLAVRQCRRLAECFADGPTSVISVAAPLRIPSHRCRLLGQFLFSWGRETVFLEER